MLYRKNYFCIIISIIFALLAINNVDAKEPMQPDNFTEPIVPSNYGKQPPMQPDNFSEQDAFAQIISELEQMPEDKLQELEQQLQSEVKRELEAMTPERRKEFENEMADFWRAQGVDPSMLPSLDELIGTQPGEPTAPVTIQTSPSIPETQKKEIISSQYSISEIASILHELLHNLESLRQKIALYPNLTRKLHVWREAIDDLVYYVKILNKKEHLERFTEKEFEPLVHKLKSLRNTLLTFEPQFINMTKRSQDGIDDPYEILRISPQATDQEIKDTYEAYAKENDPQTLRTKLAEEGLSEDDIEGRIKTAQLALHTAQEAYEKISDPKIRAQTDRTMAAAHEQQHATEASSQNALTQMLDALSQAIYQGNILSDIQKFLEKYEPTQLALKKKMEAAELKQRQEQEIASKRKPTATPGSYEPIYPQMGRPTSNLEGYYPGYGHDHYDYGHPDYGYYDDYGSSSSTPDHSSNAGQPRSSQEKAKEAAETEEGSEESRDKKSAADKTKTDKDKKVTSEAWNNALHTLENELGKLESFIVVTESTQKPEEQAQTLITQFNDQYNKLQQNAMQLEQQAAALEIKKSAPAPEISDDLSEDDVKKATEEIERAEKDLNSNNTAFEKLSGDMQKQASEVHQKLSQLLEQKDSPITDTTKAAKEFSKINTKAQDDKVKIPNAQTQWDVIHKKYARVFDLMRTIELTGTLAQTEPASKTKSLAAAAKEAAEPSKPQKHQELAKALNKINEQLAVPVSA